MLKQTPNGPVGSLFAVNYDAAAGAAGIERPQQCSSEAQAGDYFSTLAVRNIDLDIYFPQLLIDSFSTPTALAAEFGIEICDIQAIVDPAQTSTLR